MAPAPLPSKFYTPSETKAVLRNFLERRTLGPDPSSADEAAACAVLRHNIYIDGQHTDIHEVNGMHCNYLELWKNMNHQDHNKFINDSERDLWDAVTHLLSAQNYFANNWIHQATALDRIDGGFTLVLRVQGKLPLKTDMASFGPKNLVTHCYLPRREVEENRKQLEQPLASIIQMFAYDIGLPYLSQLHQCCDISKTDATRVWRGINLDLVEKDVNVDIFPLLWAPITSTSTVYIFPCRDAGVLEKALKDLDKEAKLVDEELEKVFAEDTFDIEDVSHVRA